MLIFTKENARLDTGGGKNMNSEIISTEHLCLRHCKEEKDLSAMQRLLSDAEVNNFLPWFPLRTA